MSNKEGKLVQRDNGRFVKGVSGNPAGRPVGSKNKVAQLKVTSEEIFRMGSAEKTNTVLHLILDQALAGDKPSQKLVWDANVSKANIQDDKTAGAKQQITIHRMEVAKEGDIIDISKEEDDEQIKQSGAVDSPVPTH